MGTIENVDGLLAQMVLDPATSIKVASSLLLPLRRAPERGHLALPDWFAG